VGRDGRDAERVMREGADPVWSTRGELAFTAAEEHCPDCHEPATGEVRVRGRDGAIRALARGSEPDWSPSGRQLVLVSGAGLFVVAADGSGRRRLYSSSRRPPSSPSWSPDGDSIAFLVSAHSVAVVPARGGRVRTLFEVPCPGSLCDDGDAATVNDLAWQPRPR
jgi:dipeptidyl aminopeptidase/acylaminoacyl peptidase